MRPNANAGTQGDVWADEYVWTDGHVLDEGGLLSTIAVGWIDMVDASEA